MRKKFLANLNLSLLFFLIFLFCYSWFFLDVNPKELTIYWLANLGSGVGVSVSVPANPYNTIASQLKDWHNQLEEREKILNQKELEINQKKIIQGQVILNLIFAVLVIIFFLVLLNFYLDFKYRKNNENN